MHDPNPLRTTTRLITSHPDNRVGMKRFVVLDERGNNLAGFSLMPRHTQDPEEGPYLFQVTDPSGFIVARGSAPSESLAHHAAKAIGSVTETTILSREGAS